MSGKVCVCVGGGGVREREREGDKQAGIQADREG